MRPMQDRTRTSIPPRARGRRKMTKTRKREKRRRKKEGIWRSSLRMRWR
jgi:hypothetical protein